MNIDRSKLVTAASKSETERSNLRTAIDRERDRRMEAGFEFAGVIYQSRVTDRENISSAAQVAFMATMSGAEAGDLRWSDPDADFEWIAADNTRVPMDAPTVVELGKAAVARKAALTFAASDIKQMDPVPADYTNDKWWPA